MLRPWLVSPPAKIVGPSVAILCPFDRGVSRKVGGSLRFLSKGVREEATGWLNCLYTENELIDRSSCNLLRSSVFFLFEDGEEGLDCFQKKKFNIEAIISCQWCLWCAWALKRIKRLEGETKLRESGVHRGNKYSITMIVCGKKIILV